MRYKFVLLLFIIFAKTNVSGAIDGALGELQGNLNLLSEQVEKANIQESFTKEQEKQLHHAMKWLEAPNDTDLRFKVKEMVKEFGPEDYASFVGKFIKEKLNFIIPANRVILEKPYLSSNQDFFVGDFLVKHELSLLHFNLDTFFHKKLAEVR